MGQRAAQAVTCLTVPSVSESLLFIILHADCLSLNSIQYSSGLAFWKLIWIDPLSQAPRSGSLAPGKTALPPRRKC